MNTFHDLDNAKNEIQGFFFFLHFETYYFVFCIFFPILTLLQNCYGFMIELRFIFFCYSLSVNTLQRHCF